MAKKHYLKIKLKQSVLGTTNQAIDDFERTVRVSIPSVYKKFLTFHNGGYPIKRNISFGKLPYQDTIIKCFLGIDSPLEYDLKHTLKIYDNRIPAGYLPIAFDEFDNLILISCLPKNGNKIYFWDHEHELINDSLTIIADSLQLFLGMLKEDTTKECQIATIMFDNNEICRRVLPSNLFSLDRNKVVDVSQAKVGETIKEFGEIKRIVSITISTETIVN